MCVPVCVLGAQYKIESAASQISFTTNHLNDGAVKGTFSEFSGSINWPPSAGQEMADVQGEVQVASLNTDNRIRDSHLKSFVFFNESKHPTISFKSEKIVTSNSGVKVVGLLTIKGESRTVTLNPTIEVTGDVLKMTGDYTLNRLEYGVSAYERIIKPEVAVRFEIVARTR